MRHTLSSKNGFTLTELLVGMALAGVVMAGAHSVYRSQQKAYALQEGLAEVQQNLRAAMHFVEREIRMAGCDPTGVSGAGIKTATADTIRITMDITGGESDGIDNDSDGSVDEADEARFSDGDTDDANEDITYSLYNSGGIQKLGRKRGTTSNQPVAENIEALDFVYLDQRISDGIDNNSDGRVDEANEAIMATPVANLEDIRAIQITLVARTGRADHGYINTEVYTNQEGTVILAQQNDHYRRRLLTAEVFCRNLAF